MAGVWSDESKLARWLDVELAALDGWAELGVVPADAVAEIRARREAADAGARRRARARDAATTWPRSSTRSRRELGADGRWLHYGLTSSDVVDTALALQLRDAGALLLEGSTARSTPSSRARRGAPATTICIGRTHGVHAEPTTFGLKLAGWAFELDRGRDAARARARGDARRQALGRGRDVRGDRPGARADRLRAARARAGRRSRRRSSRATGTPSCSPRSRSSPRRSTGSRPRSATSRAPRCARCRSRSARGRRARRRCRTSATRSSPSGSAASRASSAPPRWSGSRTSPLWHERDISHSSAERVVIPDAFLALDYMLDRFTWLVEGLVVRPERMRANLEASHGLFFSQRVLLALVEAGLPRDEAYRLVQRARAARLGRGASTSASSSRADDEIAGRVDLDAVFDLGAYTRHVDAVFERLRALAAKGGARPCLKRPSTSGAARSASSTSSTTSACCSSPATGSRPSTSSCRPRSPTRAACSPACRRSGSRARARSAEPPARAAARRPLDRVPAAGDAADRVRRPRLPRRLGLEGLPGDRRRLRARAAGGAARVGPAAGADLHARDQGRRAATTRTSTASRRPRSSGASATRRSSGRRSRSTASPPSTRPSAGS